MSDESKPNTDPNDPPNDPPLLRRRKFLMRLTLGLGAFSAASVLWAIVGFVAAPVLRKNKPVWRDVGPIDDFPIGATKLVRFENSSSVPWAGSAAQSAAWLRRDAKDTFTCFSVNCTHLGCPVRWEEGSELFMCPCHGGVYYHDGVVAAGPPPKPLPRYNARVRNGNVQVQAGAIPITLGV